MSELEIVKKPEWISYDDIHELLYKAHETNRNNGFDVNTAHMSGKEIEEHIGDEGVCLVALDGEKLAGVAAFRVRNRNYRFVKGKVAEFVLFGVLPEYRGNGISLKFINKLEETALASGIKYAEGRTAENNKAVLKLMKNDGWRYIDFVAPESDHYNVIALKWLDGSGVPKWRIALHFKIKKILVKIKYKPGKIKRFGKE